MLNIEDIFMIKEKNGSYRLSNRGNKIKLFTPIGIFPFGIEVFNKKEILNFEIFNDNNDANNFISLIDNIENIFSQYTNKQTFQFKNMHPEYKSDVAYKTYMPILKKSLKGYILRCHFDNTQIYKENCSNNKVTKEYLSKNDLKNGKYKCEIEISNIWNFMASYGLKIKINSIIKVE